MNRKQLLLAALADGEFHSGQDLAARAGISRTAVWKHIRAFIQAGLEFESVRGRGYRLRRPVELLDTGRVLDCLPDEVKALPLKLEILFETGSTNQYLLDRIDKAPLHGRAVLAESQTAGRGRGANVWLSAPASAICLSLGWHFDDAPDLLTALSLAVGVAAAEALTQAGCRRLQLKWPNDIVVDGAKLGGILIESRGQIAGACDVVIGIGINVHISRDMAGMIDRDVTDLNRQLAPDVPSRNRIAALLISHLVSMMEKYTEQGFAGFSQRWRDLDYSRGRTAVLYQSGITQTGRVVDIDENGFLIMSINGEKKKFSSGELSLRLMQ